MSELTSPWPIIKLNKLATVNDGTHFTPNYQATGVPFLRVTDITKKSFDLKDLKYISESEHSFLKKRCYPQKGDILYSKNGTIGISKIIDWDFEFSIFVSLALVKIKDQKIISTKYLEIILNSNFVWSQIKKRAKQGTVTNLHLEEMRDFDIPTPNLSIQKKVVAIYSCISNSISQTEKTISKLQKIKSGLMQDLFTRGVDEDGKLRPTFKERPELYKESSLGMIPKNWEIKSICDVTDYVDYRGKTPPKSDVGIFLVTAKNIKDGVIDYEASREFIKNESFETAMSRGKVKIGDVLITTEAPMGNVAQIDREGIALAQRVIKYRGQRDKLSNNFLCKFLMSSRFQRQLLAEATGSTVLGIKGSRLHKLKIIIPTLKEQETIADFICHHELAVKIEQDQLEKLNSIKQGLMQDLLTGKVPVKEDK